MPHVSFDHRAFTIDGQRTLLMSGAIHYPRSTPDMWADLFERSREAGLNTIETYVFWGLHEKKQGVYDFSGRLDLRRFITLAQEHGLNVILRIGPYICAEINYGGFPAWLRDVPGMRTRTWNQPFMQEMERWVRFVVDYLRDLFAPGGGPIIAAQIENEYNLIAATYGEDGERYRQWAADLGNALGLGVPWIMCVGGAKGAVETINGFLGHTFLENHWAEHPEQPGIWTENWPGWYDVWGKPHHGREAAHVAYGVARFIGQGGTGVNYYMWHGGTNFGREAMYQQTTSYDYDAPLDEFGLPTRKSAHLGRLNRLLNRYAQTLLYSDRPAARPLGAEQVAYSYGSLAFLCNDSQTDAAVVDWGGAQYLLSPQSVTIVDDRELLFRTDVVDWAPDLERSMAPVDGALGAFAYHAEPLPRDRGMAPVVADRPIEQLKLTRDETDYCWYATRFAADGPGTLTLAGVADYVYVYVDGRPVAQTAGGLAENRGPLDGEGFTQSFALLLDPGEHLLEVLCCAVGLIKGDWQIGMQNMADEAKGLFGQALWNGRPLTGPWAMHPGLVGEQSGLYAGCPWEGAISGGIGRPLTWWRTSFDRPAGDGPLAVDLGSMTKGLAWVNGQCIGRYWSIAGSGETDPWLQPPVTDHRVGEPTQRYYHIPAGWLREQGNVLVLFEESGGDPREIRLCRPVAAGAK